MKIQFLNTYGYVKNFCCFFFHIQIIFYNFFLFLNYKGNIFIITNGFSVQYCIIIFSCMAVMIYPFLISIIRIWLSQLIRQFGIEISVSYAVCFKKKHCDFLKLQNVALDNVFHNTRNHFLIALFFTFVFGFLRYSAFSTNLF